MMPIPIENSQTGSTSRARQGIPSWRTERIGPYDACARVQPPSQESTVSEARPEQKYSAPDGTNEGGGSANSTIATKITDRLASNARLKLPEDHFVVQTGFGLEYREGTVVGRALLRPAMWGEGTQRTRLGIFATLVDVVGGHVPDGARTPTLDLRVQMLSDPPVEGPIELVGRPWRVGRRFVVAETLLRDERGRLFGRGTTTFLNNAFEASHPRQATVPEPSIASFDRLLGARLVDARSLELDPAPRLSNGLVGTVQGGAQALLAELTAEHLLGGRRASIDLDMRFVWRLESGPLRAIAERVGRQGSLDVIRVDLVDGGAQGALVSTATILSRPVDD